MGLLSRMGGGIVQAARPGGPMSKLVEASFLEEQKEADRTYLEGSETTKHKRLVGREAKAFERLTSAADTKWKRELKALKIKSDDAIKLAQSTGQIEYYKDALKIQSDLMQKEIEIQRFYLQTGQFEVASPENQERKFKAYQSSIERLRAAQETYNNLDSQRRVISGLPPSIGLETEDLDINAAVNMAAEEIIRSGEEEGATGLISVPTMTDQVKSINDMLERKKMPIMTPEQEASFRELVEAQVRGIGGQQMPSEVSTALGVKPEMSIYERQKIEADARRRQEEVTTKAVSTVPITKAPSPDVRDILVPTVEGITGEGAAPEIGTAGITWGQIGQWIKERFPYDTKRIRDRETLYVSRMSDEGRLFWNSFRDAVEDIGVDAAITSLAEQFEALSNADKAIMYEFNSNLAPRGRKRGRMQDTRASNDSMIEDLIEKFSKPARA